MMILKDLFNFLDYVVNVVSERTYKKKTPVEQLDSCIARSKMAENISL